MDRRARLQPARGEGRAGGWLWATRLTHLPHGWDARARSSAHGGRGLLPDPRALLGRRLQARGSTLSISHASSPAPSSSPALGSTETPFPPGKPTGASALTCRPELFPPSARPAPPRPALPCCQTRPKPGSIPDCPVALTPSPPCSLTFSPTARPLPPERHTRSSGRDHCKGLLTSPPAPPFLTPLRLRQRPA